MLHKNNFTCVTLKRKCKKKIEKNQIQYTHIQTHFIWNIYLLTASASSTSQILMPVAGLKVGNILPLVDGSHLLSIKICNHTNKQINASMPYKQEWSGAKVTLAPSSYLAVSDIWHFHRQRKRMSLDRLHKPVCSASILGHFFTAVQSRTCSSVCSLPTDWLFFFFL